MASSDLSKYILRMLGPRPTNCRKLAHLWDERCKALMRGPGIDIDAIHRKQRAP